MNFVKIIEQNLFRDVFDQEARNLTCLPDEKCKYCGKELLSQRSLQLGHCALCHPNGDKKLRCKVHRTKARCNLISQDPDFNFGHGKQFYNAVERVIRRGDFR